MTAGSRPEAPPPVRPRPRHGETADSYLRRLAAANHLHFSYLRRYLATRQGSYDPVDPARLAALAGREPDAILRAFPELAPAAPRPATWRYPREEVERNRAARREKYAAIRRDADNGYTQRAIINRNEWMPVDWAIWWFFPNAAHRMSVSCNLGHYLAFHGINMVLIQYDEFALKFPRR